VTLSCLLAVPFLLPQPSPAARHGQAAGLFDSSWLLDTGLDNFYTDEIIQNVIDQGVHTRMAMEAARDAAMNMNMDVDGTPLSPQQQQQQQRGGNVQLSAGMGRELLQGPADPRRAHKPWASSRRQPGPAGPEGGTPATPAEATPVSEGPDQQQQQQQQQQGSEQEGSGALQGQGGEQGAGDDAFDMAAAGAAAAAAGQPNGVVPLPEEEAPQQKQQQLLHQQHQQQQGVVGQLLAGDAAAWPLMPGPRHIVMVLLEKGLSGLSLWLYDGLFSDYNLEVSGQHGRLQHVSVPSFCQACHTL
jgi:hypothetical protein